MIDRDNFNQDSTHQAGQVTSKERITGEHRELQAAKRGLSLAQEAGGADSRPQRPRGQDVQPRLLPGRPPSLGHGVRAPPQVKTPKPPQSNLPERVRITDAAPGKGGPGEGGGDTEDTDPRDLEEGGAPSDLASAAAAPRATERGFEARSRY